MSDLLEFLAARLDEDEAAVRAVTAARRYDEWDAVGAAGDDEAADLTWHVVGITAMKPEPGAKAIAHHIARHDPARVLRDVMAQRAIVDAYAVTDGDVELHLGNFPRKHGEWDGLGLAVRQLATVYSDHPHYQQEWAPEQ